MNAETGFVESMNEINNRLDTLAASLQAYETKTVKPGDLLAAFADVFDLLLKDGIAEGNIFKSLHKAKQKPKDIYALVKKLDQLFTAIDGVEDAFKYKTLLQQRVTDNFSKREINQFLEAYEQFPSESVTTFLDRHRVKSYENTVEVRTWGTKNEYSNGLRNVIKNQFKGNDVGHAALVLRLPVNEESLTLIKKYCLSSNAKMRVPFEIKRYGNESVYEVYWSYWPDRLESQKSDFEKERQGIEYLSESDITQSMSKELSEQYLLKKYRQGKMITLAPASQYINHDKSLSEQRRQYLKLKEEKYALNEEAESLESIVDNYLAPNKKFNAGNINKQAKIDEGSNFRVLLQRFKYQFKDRPFIANILLTNQISKEESIQLSNALNTLREQKKSDKAIVKTKLRKLATQLNLTSTIEKTVKTKAKKQLAQGGSSQSKKNKQSLNSKKQELDMLVKVIDALNLIKNKGDGHIEKIPVESKLLAQLSIIKLNSKEVHEFRTALKKTHRLVVDSVFHQFLDRHIQQLEVIKKDILDLEQKSDLYFDVNELHQFYVDELDLNKEHNLKLAALNEKIEEMNDLTDLLDAMDKEQAYHQTFSILDFEPGVGFYHDSRTYEIKDSESAKAFREKVEKEKNKLEQNKKSLMTLIGANRVKSRLSKAQLKAEKMQRGIPYHSSTLEGFNIEEMLKKASELADTTKNFKLSVENCSTTSMKVLNAGAPLEFRDFFYWSEPKKGEKYASNAYLTNPQAVFTASKVCEKTQHKVPGAEKIAEKIKRAQGDNKTYTYLFNRISSIDREDLKDYKKYTWTFLSLAWGLITSPVSIYSFIKDYFFPHVVEDENKDQAILNKMDDAILSLSNNKHLYIQSTQPAIAIYEMMSLLKGSGTNIPFFHRQTLNNIDIYLLTIEAKEEPTQPEKELLKHYNEIINERNARINRVESALLQGDEVENCLLAKASKAFSLKWTPSEGEVSEYKLTLFMKAYEKEKHAQFLWFLRPSIISQLSDRLSTDEKLTLIETYAEKYPTSLTAKAWGNVFKNDLLNSIEGADELPDLEALFYKTDLNEENHEKAFTPKSDYVSDNDKKPLKGQGLFSRPDFGPKEERPAAEAAKATLAKGA